MLRYKLQDGEMVEAVDGNYILTADVVPLSIGLKALDERLKDFMVMYPSGTQNSEIFRDVRFIIEDLIKGLGE